MPGKYVNYLVELMDSLGKFVVSLQETWFDREIWRWIKKENQ